MKYAVIENGIVSNIVEATPEFAQENNWVECDFASVGWLYENGEFKEPPIDLEYFAEQVRQKRNQDLFISDWTQLADSNVDKTAWATYRQALRDIPAQVGFPLEVTFPTKPE